MRITIVIIFVGLLPFLTKAQNGLDSILVNERSIDRPVIVHDRQLRVTAGYGFSTFNSRFDDSGEKISLSSEGTTNILHALNLGLEYGFRELLQLRLEINFKSNNQRQQAINIIAPPDNPVQITEVSRFNGAEDLFVGLDFLVPRKNKRLDVAFSAGVSLPTASSDPDRPSHSFSDDGQNVFIDYEFNENRGLGVLKAFGGAQFKYRWQDFAVSSVFTYGFPLDESESSVWSQRLESNNEFEYRSANFSWSPAEDYALLVKAEYQLYPWIDLFTDIEVFATRGGWTERSGQRIGFRDQRLTTVGPGVEILLTSKVWIRQRLIFTVEGENTFTPFAVQTTLLYNFFPF